MAGASSRFFNAGYEVPKYMLPLPDGSNLFKKSVSSFKYYFDIAEFDFVVNSEIAGPGIEDIVKKYCKELGVLYYRIYDVRRLTRGQAETVYECLDHFNKLNSNEQLVIFNIDTIIENWKLPEIAAYAEAGFHAFYDENADEKKWSFASIEPNLEHVPGILSKRDCLKHNYMIKETAEKRKVGFWCSTGLYWFSKISIFAEAYKRAQERNSYNYYVAPLFNRCFLKLKYNSRAKVFPCDKDDVVFVGVPEEYESYLKTFQTQE